MQAVFIRWSTAFNRHTCFPPLITQLWAQTSTASVQCLNVHMGQIPLVLIYKPAIIGKPKTAPPSCDLLNHNAPARKGNNSIYQEMSVVNKRERKWCVAQQTWKPGSLFWQCPLGEQGGELCSRGVWRSWEGINTNLLTPVWAKPSREQKCCFLLKQNKFYCKLLTNRMTNVYSIAGSRI